MDVLGAQVSEVGEGWCVIEVPYSEKLTQQQRYTDLSERRLDAVTI